MPARKKPETSQSEQSRRFIEQAKALGCHDDEKAFAETVRKIASHKAAGKKPQQRAK